MNKKNINFPVPQVIQASSDSLIQVKGSRSVDTSTSNQSSSVRRNRSASISRSDKYANIEGGVIPFTYGSGGGKYNSNISIKDTIILCQKAYYNFSIFRNTIDLMTEFSCSPIYFTGGNEQSRKFFTSWSDKINLWRLQDMFFREFFRSGNVFLYKLSAEFNKQDMRVISDLMIGEAKSNQIPIRYVILNPADIQAVGSASFITPKYIKILNDFEMQVLLNPSTPQDKQLSEKIVDIKKFKDAKTSNLHQQMVFDLDEEKFIPIFYKKQDYEPFSVPMGFPVLEDINWKAELKNMDMAISRTIQQAVLLVTMGNDEVGMPTKDQIGNLRKIFENESVGRILVTDYTTNIKFIIPEIGQILDPKKYEVVDRDIRYGLNNVLFGEEKYANTSTKIEVFLSRLKHARETFLNEFIIPEIKKIGKNLNFKNLPTPRFKDADFKSDSNLTRIYSRLIELGVLTPEEGLTAIDTGRLPLPEESIESQKKFTKLQEDGLYQPLLNKAQNLNTEAGRPGGTTGVKQSTKTPGKIGTASSYNDLIDANLVTKNLLSYDQLESNITSKLKNQFNKKRLTADQRNIIKDVSEMIAINEDPLNWNSKIEEYCKEPKTIKAHNLEEINKISENFGVDIKTAIVLFHSKKNLDRQ
jgi:hypothetical protein